MKLDKITQVLLLQVLAKTITGTEVTVDRSMNIEKDDLKIPVCINGAGQNLTYSLFEDTIVLSISGFLGDSTLISGYGLDFHDIVYRKKLKLIHEKLTNVTTLVLGEYPPIIINREIEKQYRMIMFEDLFADLLLEHKDYMASF